MPTDHTVDPFTESLFEQVAAEISLGHVKQGLWLKARVDCNGDDVRARLLYAGYRVEQLRSELLKTAAERDAREKATQADNDAREKAAMAQSEKGIAAYGRQEILKTLVWLGALFGLIVAIAFSVAFLG